MKEYFIVINDARIGPLTFDELITKNIYNDTLVWKNGWDDWKTASIVDELSSFIIRTPPPTPFEKKKIKKIKVFDDFKLFVSQNAVKYIISSLLATLVIDLIVMKMAFSENVYSDIYPIYLTEKQRNNPTSFFLEMIPISAIIGFVLLTIVFAIYYFLKWNTSQVRDHNFENSNKKKHKFTTIILMFFYGLFGPSNFLNSLVEFYAKPDMYGSNFISLIFGIIVTYFGFRFFKEELETKVIIIGTLFSVFFVISFVFFIAGFTVEFNKNGEGFVVSFFGLVFSLVFYFLANKSLNKH